MKQGKKPDPTMIHPIVGYDKEIYVKPTIKNPNIIVGDFTYIADSEFDEDFEKVVIPLIPMGKLIQPDDIAETILFLASKLARMITGQVIKVSGGKAL